MSIYTNSVVTKIVNNKSMRKIASQISNHKALLPVIALEVATTGGRTYQAYKRGGITEARERIIDESITAVIWFGVIEWLNQGFNFLFKKGGLPEIDIDMGKDAIRNPIKHAISKRSGIKNYIGGLKLSKIALASFIGIYTSGVLLPKFYQNMTKKILKKEKEKEKENNKFKNIENNTKISMQDFLDKTNKKSLTFGSSFNDGICRLAHIIEKNPIAHLLTIDGGLFIGRAKSARNTDEMNEFIFRDCASSFFYLGSTPLIYTALSKFADKYKGKNTNLDPKTVDYVTQYIKQKLPVNGSSANDFLKNFLGDNENLVKQIQSQIKNETIDINDFESMIKTLVSDNSEKANAIINNAKAFISKRPVGASKNLLTLSEAINSAKGGLLNNADFLTNAVKNATGGASQNEMRFISFKEIDKIKQNIQDYAESIVQYAKKTGADTINESILQQAKNRNMLVKMLYTLVGLAVSATFLSTIIPKIQYKITEMRTGKKDFPGIRDIK